VVPREKIEDYIEEADCVLIGPGMLRAEGAISNFKFQISNLKELEDIEDEGLQTYLLTQYLLLRYSSKRWVIDAGALQMMEPEWLSQLHGNVIVTPHKGEFDRLFGHVILGSGATPESIKHRDYIDPGQARMTDGKVQEFTKRYNCIVLLKGQEDIICSPSECVKVTGGNAGMTKGGTGDVLAGLVAALACKNELFLSACAGSFINKKAGDELFKRVGYYFNSSDLVDEIPKVMRSLFPSLIAFESS
ncbi:MAG: NAD(P)H-hydrate dehydratase, partial [Candidatus Levybacteria bacterium]|nr:NAD(P)H-hydrate dehydratase [Candidatus Levybacteria bacterium]